MGRRNSQMAAFDSDAVAASVAVSSSFEPPASYHGLADPQADHVRGLCGRVVDGLGELDALPKQLPLPLRGLLSPDPFEPGDEADGCDDGIHGHHPEEQGLLLTRIEIETRAHRQADHGIDGPRYRRPGEAEPQGREDDREQRQGGIVGHVAEEVEVTADDDGGGDQRDIHAAEEEQPAPRHRPVPLEPVVDEPVERQQRHAQEQVLLVGGVPERRSIGQFEHADEADEPARPDRDPRGVQHHVRVGADGPEDPPAQFGAEHVLWHQYRWPPLTCRVSAVACRTPKRTATVRRCRD